MFLPGAMASSWRGTAPAHSPLADKPPYESYPRKAFVANNFVFDRSWTNTFVNFTPLMVMILLHIDNLRFRLVMLRRSPKGYDQLTALEMNEQPGNEPDFELRIVIFSQKLWLNYSKDMLIVVQRGHQKRYCNEPSSNGLFGVRI